MRIRVNEDREFVNQMRQALRDNDGYCPCSLVKSADTKCMCKAFLEMDVGVCHCGLYIKERE